MKTIRRVLAFILLVSCVQSDIKEAANWTAQMQGMATAMNSLFPYIYADKNFKNPGNHDKILPAMENLAHHAKQLSSATGEQISGSDPFFKLGLVGLQRTTRKALDTYESGSYDYSQLLIQSAVHYCFNCHSRTNVGPSLVQWDQFKLPTDVDVVTEIRALVSSRQFIKAGEVADKYLFTSQFEKEWELVKALKLRLIIALRQHEDPTEALKVINRLEKSRYSAKFGPDTRELIAAWKQALRTWETNNQAGRYLTLEQILAKSAYLGHKPEYNFVIFLRESTILHKGLQQLTSAEDRAKAYFRLGLIYAKLTEVGFWELPEYYFEACIRAYPESPLSQRCYYQLEEMVSRENSKGSEVIIPRREKNYLNHLYMMTQHRKTSFGSGGYNYDN